MRLLTFASTSLLTVLVGLTPVQAQSLSEADRYKLCADSPTNTECQGYVAPIALNDRPGEAGACVMTANEVETQTVCKLVITENKVVVYYEVGEKLSFLDRRKATREVQINPSEIKTLQYQEGSKDNSTARVLNTLLFGLSGLFTRDKAVSEIALGYTIVAPIASPTATATSPIATATSPIATATSPTATSPTATAASPTATSGTPVNLSEVPVTGNLAATADQIKADRIKIVVRRKTGKNLRLQLEQLTGITAETPMPREEKKPEPEQSESQN
jgi:hypothetical protein